MSRDIFNTAVSVIKLLASTMSLRSLRRLLKDIVEFKIEQGNRLTEKQLHHLLRCESSVNYEIGLRVNLTAGENLELKTREDLKNNYRKKLF
jgi:hypothetical protein